MSILVVWREYISFSIKIPCYVLSNKYDNCIFRNIGVFIHIFFIKFAGFENVYETLKRAVEASKVVQYFCLFYG